MEPPPGCPTLGRRRRVQPGQREPGRSWLRGRLRLAVVVLLAAAAVGCTGQPPATQLLEVEIADHTKAITALVRAWRPDLLSRCGVGPIVAAVVLCAWSHPGPLRKRRRLRHAGWGCPDPGLLRPDRGGAPQPRWGPSAQPGPAPGGPDQAAL
jgi:hypothetical protein